MKATDEVGKNISHFRKIEGLTKKELAEKAGLSLSMISQIERGIANPSLNTLNLISRVLKVPLPRLFLEDQMSSALIIRANKRERIIFPESPSLEYEILAPHYAESVSMLQLTLRQGMSTATLKTKYTGEEIAYILQGKVRLILEDEEADLSVGDSVHIPPGIKHRWMGMADVDSIILYAIAPPRF